MDARILQLQDTLDETQTKLNKTKKALRRARQQGFNLEEDELTLDDELTRVKQQSGLTKTETNQLIMEKIEYVSSILLLRF